MLLSATLFLATLLVGGYYLLKRIKYVAYSYNVMLKIPGPAASGVLLGNMSHLQTSPEKIMTRLIQFSKDFYPIFKMYAVHKVTANLVTPEDCELIMSNPAHIMKNDIYKLLHTWLDDGLLTSTGAKWQTRRKILTPAFHFNILQEFIPIFNEEAEELVEVLKKESKNSCINVTPHITQFTLKTIAQTAMGTKFSFHTKEEVDYKKALQIKCKILVYRITHPWFIDNFINLFSPWYFEEYKVTRRLQQFTKKVIRHREENFKDVELPKEEHDVYKGKKRLAMLDLLLSAKRNERIIDNGGIQEEVDTFMFEGHDTTAMALSFLLMLLANNEEAQNLILEEMGEVLGDLRKKPSYSDLQNLKYLERCVKEGLRLYPSVYFIGRQLGEDVKTHTGYLLPKGVNVVMHIYAIHHNPEIYPDPEKFDPDRFLPENSLNRHPYAYLPFSAGPRNCIGQRFAMLELKAAVCAILANFVLKPVDTPETIVLVADIVLRTKEGIKVNFVYRT